MIALHKIEPRAACTAMLSIQALPPQTQVWVLWTGQEGRREVDGPYEALFIGFVIRSYRVMSDGIRRSEYVTKKGDTHTVEEAVFPDWSDPFAEEITEEMKYASTVVFVKQDWEEPWISLGDEAFWTEAAARTTADERNASHASRNGAVDP